MGIGKQCDYPHVSTRQSFLSIEIDTPSKHRLSGWRAFQWVECLPHEALGQIPIPASNWALQCKPVIPALGQQGQEGQKFKVFATTQKTIFLLMSQ